LSPVFESDGRTRSAWIKVAIMMTAPEPERIVHHCHPTLENFPGHFARRILTISGEIRNRNHLTAGAYDRT